LCARWVMSVCWRLSESSSYRTNFHSTSAAMQCRGGGGQTEH
jgi:hypothetical protein